MKNTVNKNMKALRKLHRLTQEEMGKILDMKRSTYAHTESYGTFKPEHLIKAAEHFHITVNDIIYGTFDKTITSKYPPAQPVEDKNEKTIFPLAPQEINLIEMFRKLDPDRKKEISYEIMKG